MNELDGSDDERPTSEGSDGPQYGADDSGEEMGSYSQAAIHTMSHVFLMGMELVATMFIAYVTLCFALRAHVSMALTGHESPINGHSEGAMRQRYYHPYSESLVSI